MEYAIDTRKQSNLIKKMFDEKLQKLLGDCDAFIAGGAISSIFSNRPINDIDMYFPNEEALKQVVAYLSKMQNWEGQFESNFATTFKCKLSEEKCVDYGLTTRINDFKVQLVTIYYGSVDEIFMSFDFHCCMGAYRFKTGEFKFDPLFIPDNLSKNLRFNYGTLSNPIGTFFRIEKYRNYGFEIRVEELLKIALAIRKMKVETRSDLKKMIKTLPPGMYKRILLDELTKPLEGMNIDYNDESGRKMYRDFMNGPCDLEFIVNILSDMDSFIEQNKDREDGAGALKSFYDMYVKGTKV